MTPCHNPDCILGGAHTTRNNARQCVGISQKWHDGMHEHTNQLAYNTDIDLTPSPPTSVARRYRALELARVYVAATKEKDQYDKSLNASNRLAEELKIARFLLGGSDA